MLNLIRAFVDRYGGFGQPIGLPKSRAGLYDNQKALLAIADVPAEKQVAEVLKLKEQYAGGTRKPRPAKSSAPSSAAAATDQEPNDAGDGTDEAEADAERSTDPAEEVENNSDDSEAGAESPSTVPQDDGLDIPPILLAASPATAGESSEQRGTIREGPVGFVRLAIPTPVALERGSPNGMRWPVGNFLL